MKITIRRETWPFLSLKRYIYASTLLGVFSGALSIDVGSTVFFFYFIMVINLLLIWGFIGSIVLPKWLLWLTLFLGLSGGIGIARGTDTASLALKQLAAILLSALYFANFFNIADNSITKVWNGYCRIAYYFSLLALLLWPLQCVIAGDIERLHGAATEPAAFCLLTLPACYWYAYLWKTTGTHRKEVLLILIAIGISASSLGYLGVALGVALLSSSSGWSITKLLVPVAALGLLVVAYVGSSDFRVRTNDTFAAIASNSVSDTNFSTYALVSNIFVTEKVLETHPLLGNGIGSHVLSNDRYIAEIPGVEEVVRSGWDAGANTHDAASLTLRALSEMGVVGLGAILIFIFHFKVRGYGPHSAISNAILLVFFEKLLRGGGYSNPEQFFFVTTYMLNWTCSASSSHADKTARPIKAELRVQ